MPPLSNVAFSYLEHNLHTRIFSGLLSRQNVSDEGSRSRHTHLEARHIGGLRARQ